MVCVYYMHCIMWYTKMCFVSIGVISSCLVSPWVIYIQSLSVLKDLLDSGVKYVYKCDTAYSGIVSMGVL